MVQFRNAEREIQFKIVYYGPALGGKTTNIEALHEITDVEGKSSVTSLKTSEDRTLFFDFMPFELGEIQGYKIRIQIYTVPGQVHYNTTRKVVLAGADGVVFVADSAPTRLQENYTSYENMKSNLLANRMNTSDIPVVIQCNKRDLPDASPIPLILAAMRLDAKEAFGACAITGEGVVPTFQSVVQQALASFARKFQLDKKGVTTEQLESGVKRFFAPFLNAKRGGAPATPQPEPLEAKVTLAQPLSEEEQLVAALQSTTQLAEQYQETERLSRMYQARLQEMTVLFELGSQIAGMESAEAVMRAVAGRLREARPQWVVSTFITDEDKPRPLLTDPLPKDPLWSAEAPGVGNMALGLLQRGGTARLDRLSERLANIGLQLPIPLDEALAVAMGSRDKSKGHLILYAPPEKPFSPEDLRFASLVERLVSPRLQAIELTAQLASANERLEQRVVERTAELAATLEKLKEMDQLKRAFLNSVSHEMRTPLTNVRSYADLLARHPEQMQAHGQEYLQVILSESMRLEALITDLLSFSKVKEPPRGDNCDLASVLDEVVEALGPKANAKYLQLQVQKEKGSLPVRINKEDARVLFYQILDNAIKFSPDGVRVKVYLLDDPEKIIYAVRDFGPGFPKDQRERLMEESREGKPQVAFFKQPGFGLGLFLVREVLGKYGGAIHIESMEPGSNVLVEFPKQAAAEARAASRK
jgi:hypothetical protein